MSLLKSSDAERLDCLTRFCQYSFSCDHHRFSGFLCAIVHRIPPIHSVMLQMLVWLLVVPLVINHVSVLSLLQHQHDGLLRGLNVSHQIQKKAPVPSAQCHQNFCVAVTRDHHVRHPHQCPEVVSLTRRASSCQVPLQGRLVLCTPQSANLCDTAHPDTSYKQVFASRIPSSTKEHFSTLAGLTQGHPTDSHATHHDDAALRLDAKQSPHLNQQSNRETKLAENVVVCRHRHVDRPGYDGEVKLISEQDFQCDSRTGKFDQTIVQVNQKIIAHQMIQDPLTQYHTHNAKRGCLMENLMPNEKTASF